MSDMLSKFLTKAAVTDVETAEIDETAPAGSERRKTSILGFLGNSDEPRLNTTDRFEMQRDAHSAHLADVNGQISAATCGGHLIPAPLCPSACEPGDLADFVAELNLDPFQRWNMMYYANDDDTGLALQTEVWDPSYSDDLDEPMSALIEAIRALWMDFKGTAPSQEALDAKRAELREYLIAECAAVEDTLFGDDGHLWRNHFGANYAPAA